jgi:hypothetical protein
LTFPSKVCTTSEIGAAEIGAAEIGAAILRAAVDQSMEEAKLKYNLS